MLDLQEAALERDRASIEDAAVRGFDNEVAGLDLIGREDRRRHAGRLAIEIARTGLDEATGGRDAGDRAKEFLGRVVGATDRTHRDGALVGQDRGALGEGEGLGAESGPDLDMSGFGRRADGEGVGEPGHPEETIGEIGGQEGSARRTDQGQVGGDLGFDGAEHRRRQGLAERDRLGRRPAGGSGGEAEGGTGRPFDAGDLSLAIGPEHDVPLQADRGELRHGGQGDIGVAGRVEDEGAPGGGGDLRAQRALGTVGKVDLQGGVRSQVGGEQLGGVRRQDALEFGRRSPEAVGPTVADAELAALDDVVFRGVARVGQPDFPGPGLEDGAAGRAGADAGAGDQAVKLPSRRRVVIVEADGGAVVDGEVGPAGGARAEAGLAADEGAGMDVDGADAVLRPETGEVEGARPQLLDGGTAHDVAAINGGGASGDIDGQDGARAVDGRAGITRHVGEVLAEAGDIQGRVSAEVHGRGGGEGRRGVQLERAAGEIDRAREGERDIELQEAAASLLEVTRALDVALIEGVIAAARHGGRGAEREGVRVDDGGDGAEQHRGAGHGIVVDAHAGLQARRGRGHGSTGDRLGGGAANPGAVSLGADDALIGDGGRGQVQGQRVRPDRDDHGAGGDAGAGDGLADVEAGGGGDGDDGARQELGAGGGRDLVGEGGAGGDVDRAEEGAVLRQRVDDDLARQHGHRAGGGEAAADGEGAGAGLGGVARAADRTSPGQVVRRVKLEVRTGANVDDTARDGGEIAGVELDGALDDVDAAGGPAGGRVDHEGARAELLETADAGDGSVELQGAGIDVDGQGAQRADVDTRGVAQGVAVDLEHASLDVGGSRVIIHARKDQPLGSDLGQAAGARDVAAEG